MVQSMLLMVSTMIGVAQGMTVLPYTRVAGCGDTFTMSGDAFTKTFWAGPGGQAFCFKGDKPVFMVDGKCTGVELDCETRQGPLGRPAPPSEQPGPKFQRINKLQVSDEPQVVRNLVLMVRFSDYGVDDVPSEEDVEKLFNAEEADGKVVISESVKSYYRKQSNNKVEFNNILSGWIDVNFTEAQAAGGCVEDPDLEVSEFEDGLSCCNGPCLFDQDIPREKKGVLELAIQEAVAKYEATVGAEFFSKFDGDNNGVIDFFTVIHSGKGAESGGGNFIFQEMIWSHKYFLNVIPYWEEYIVAEDPDSVQYVPYITPLTGMAIADYNIMNGQWHEGTINETNTDIQIAHIGVVAHEMGHFLGLPDLYDRDQSSYGLGILGLMADSWGFDRSQNYPGSISAPMKIELDWLDVIDLTKSPTTEISLGPVQETFQVARFNVSETEYYLMENRQPLGVDKFLPGGILMYHVDLNITSQNDQEFNISNPESYETDHFEVRVVQPDGFYDLELWRSNPRVVGERYYADAGDFFPYNDAFVGDDSDLQTLNTYAAFNEPSGYGFQNFTAHENGEVTFSFVAPVEENTTSVNQDAALWLGIIGGTVVSVAMVVIGIRAFKPEEEEEEERPRRTKTKTVVAESKITNPKYEV